MEKQLKKPFTPVVGKPFPPALQEVLDLIIKMIAPEKIFLTDIYDEADSPDSQVIYDLIIVVSGSDNRPYSEYDVIIKHISLRIHPVTAIILKRNDLFKKLSAGHIYFSRVCRAKNLLFDEDDSPCLPIPETLPVEDLIAASTKCFKSEMERARSFREGADYYWIKKEKELAAFMLHQSVELTYRAILKNLTGHELFSHDLRALMHRCRHYAPGLNQIFPGHNEEEKRLLRLLQKAYVNTRYRSNYEIGQDDLTTLLSRVDHLHLMAGNIFQIKIKEAEKALHQP